MNNELTKACKRLQAMVLCSDTQDLWVTRCVRKHADGTFYSIDADYGVVIIRKETKNE